MATRAGTDRNEEPVFGEPLPESASLDVRRPLLGAPEQQHASRAVWIGRLMVAFWLLTTGLAIAYREPLAQFVRKIAIWASEQGQLVYLYYVALFVVSVPLFMSVEVLLLSSGFIFSHMHGPYLGVLVATLTSFVGYFFSTLICYLLSRYLLKSVVTRYMRSYRYFEALNRAAESEGLVIVAVIRLSPLFPAAIVSYIFGSTKLSLKDYCVGSLAAIPSLAVFTYLGSLLEDLTNQQTQTGWRTIVFFCLALLVSVVAIYYTSVLTQRHLRMHQQRPEEEREDAQA